MISLAKHMRPNGRAPEAPDSPARIPMRKQIGALLSKRRGTVLILAITAILTGFAESAILIMVAETADALATGGRRTHIHFGFLHLHPSVDALIAAALVVVVIRVVLQIPGLILPPRGASQMQAEMRTSIFTAFSRASWDIQARDREGQLQETMTGQVAQATAAVYNSLGLISSTLLLAVMLLTALALNVIAAGFVVVLTVLLFSLLRPMRAKGVREARALSSAQVQYARGVAEAIRLAEETHVFGAGEAERGRL